MNQAANNVYLLSLWMLKF